MQMSLNSTWPNKHVVDRSVVNHFSLLAIHSMYWPFVAATFHVAGYIVSEWSFIGRETPLNNCSPVAHLKDGDLPCIRFPLCTWINNVNSGSYSLYLWCTVIFGIILYCVCQWTDPGIGTIHMNSALSGEGVTRMVSELCVDCRIVTLGIDY